MKITNIEVIPIAMPLAKRYDNHHGRTRMYDIDQRQRHEECSRRFRDEREIQGQLFLL